MVKVGIYGGRGYVAKELARILAVHPEAEIAWWYSREPGEVAEAHRNLAGTGLRFTTNADLADADVVFLCAPVPVAQQLAEGFLDRGSKVIAMAADFRLKNRKTFETVYGPHQSWDLVREAVYGLPELRRDEIRRARLVANPGCFSAAVILALAPLVRRPGVDLARIVVDAVSGTSGAGAALDRSMHHPEMCQTLLPYSVVGHRHTCEMEEQLSDLAGTPVTVNFTPSYGPWSRGVLAACHAFVEKTPSREDLLALYGEFYRDCRFVKVNALAKNAAAPWDYLPYPSVADVAASNYCHIGLDVDPARGRVVVFSAIDNMGKGACGTAVQNMNLMFGLDEALGIRQPGLGV